MKWKYFGRSGGQNNIFDIYRISSDFNDTPLSFEHFPEMELLQEDGTWIKGHGDILEREWISGWFDKSDEISEEEVQQLVIEWNAEGWAERRRFRY